MERDDLYRLKGNSPEEDKIIVALLRNYSGLFNDFTYIDEAFLSTQTGYTQPIVYQLLKNLSQKHIIKFVPQKRTPYIRYRQRREDSAHLIFSPAIYDNLRQKFTNRIDAMLHYVSTDNQCRSRQLLRYFGETRTHDCGQCDVCIDRKGELTQKHLLKEAEQQIMQLLNDRKEHRIKELHNLNLPYETIECALQYLIDEAIIIDNDGLLSLG